MGWHVIHCFLLVPNSPGCASATTVLRVTPPGDTGLPPSPSSPPLRSPPADSAARVMLDPTPCGPMRTLGQPLAAHWPVALAGLPLMTEGAQASAGAP